jgi:hypothetical protein
VTVQVRISHTDGSDQTLANVKATLQLVDRGIPPGADPDPEPGDPEPGDPGWEASIPGILEWWEADEAQEQFNLSDGNKPNAWPGKVHPGNERALWNEVQVRRPTFMTDQVNGHPAFLFTNVPETIDRGAYMATLSGSGGPGEQEQPNSYVFVAMTSQPDAQFINPYLVSGNYNGVSMSNFTKRLAMNGGTNLTTTALPTLNQYHLYVAVFDGANSYLRIDGQEVLAGDAGSNKQIAVTTLGAHIDTHSAKLVGGVALYAYIGERISNALRDDIETFLMGKYGLPYPNIPE